MSIKEDEKKITILFADDHWKDNRWDALFKKKLSPYHIEVICENISLANNNEVFFVGKLKNKIVVVTGCRGICKEIALTLAEEGANLAI